MKIAVFVHNEDLCSFLEAKQINIYERNDSTWAATKTITLPEFDTASPKILRAQIALVAEQLTVSDCKVIAGSDLSGISFTIFDRAGFRIFIIDAATPDTFDGIVSDIDADNVTVIIPNPTALSCVGEYEFDMVALQLEHPEISSKMALQSWLAETPFTLLKLRCPHVPPWIIKTGKYNIVETQNYENVLAEVRPK